MQLTTKDTPTETVFHIRGIEASIRQVKAEIETIVRNAGLGQFQGISVRQKSRSFDLENIKLAAPTETSALPEMQAALFKNPKAPMQGFDAALLNAPGFQGK